jgi:flagellar hook-associated protein 2
MTSVSSTSSSTSTTSTSSTTSYSTDPSTFDWSALIDDAVSAKTDRATTLETKISSNETKISAYQEVQSLLDDLETACEALRNPESSLSDDVFDSRSATITSDGSTNASSAVSMTLESGTATGSHTLQIEQLAKAEKVAGATQSTKSDALGYSGTFSIGLSGGDSATITVDTSMSLQDIADAINDESDTSNVQASVIKVSDSKYELVLSGDETGQSIVASSASGDDILNELGVTDDDGSFENVLQSAQEAKFTLDGVAMTRSSNDIDDALDGATFHLYKKTDDDETLTIEVESDTSSIETAIQSLVTAYNAFRDYAYTQQQTASGGTASSDAVLFGDGTLRTITTQISSALNTQVNGLSLADLGLSFNSKNELELDTGTLETKMASNLDDVKSLLQYTSTVSSSDLQVVSRGTAAPSSFSLDIACDASGNITSASVDGDSSLFTVSGTTILGKSGTAYEGFTFAYTGATSKSVDVSTTSGICEKLYNIADAATDTTDGPLQTLIDNLTDQDDDLQTRADEILSDAETYRTNLTARYAKYQSAINTAQSTLDYLKVLLNSSSDS